MKPSCGSIFKKRLSHLAISVRSGLLFLDTKTHDVENAVKDSSCLDTKIMATRTVWFIQKQYNNLCVNDIQIYETVISGPPKAIYSLD